jgi:hypothetical protein
MSRGRRLTLAWLISLAFGALDAHAATLFDPALTFRVLRTDHFRIYFHRGEERLAARLGPIAEDSWRALTRPLGVRPPPLTHVVLANQSELANGYATPLPYNTIVIYPASPPGSEFDTDDWLRLVFTHEFTHIVHLDRSEHWAGVVRGIFGRTLIAFPNLFLPTWQIEGLATLEESAITGEGRLHAGDFRALVTEAARARALEPLDRVNGGLTDWPSGQAPYAYGLGFHQYLVERFGERALAQLAEATARRVPYTQSAVFTRLFGESLGTLWRDYETTLVTNAGSPSMDPGVRQLTHDGFVAAAPRFDAYGGGIVYATRTPNAFPTLNRVSLDGGEPSVLATRYLGATTGIGRHALYFDQLEIARNVALSGDLYAWTRTDRRVRAVTSGARLHDPDLSPDGATLAAVREGVGSRDLVLVRLPEAGSAAGDRTSHATIDPLLADGTTQFDTPRWSPDGRDIAVVRHRLRADPEIVVVEAATGRLRRTLSAAGTRIVMPAWRPDGGAIVAAMAADDQPFNVYEFALDGSDDVRQLTHFSGGATWPDVSPDGATLVFAGYTTSGYDIFSMPYPAGTPGPRLNPGDARVDGNSAVAQGDVPYSPLPTLAPTSWQPVIEWDSDQVRIGAETGGRDVLGYHGYAASATWLAASRVDAPTPDAATPDWFVSYAYDRWRPTLFAAASSETDFFAGPATLQGTPSRTTRRQRQFEGGVVLPVIRTRISHTAFASLFRAVDDYTGTDQLPTRERTAVRTAWRTATARTYGYSISPEDGIVAGGTAEFVRRGLGASADATTVTGDVRAYIAGIRPHHILAARLAGGVSTGDRSVGRTFLLGGATTDASVIDFSSDAISLLRGFDTSTFAGSHVALLNAEYRWPLSRPQRGVGTWPLFLHTVHAAAFVDAGHAWTRAFDAASIKTSIGGELSANLVAGFYFPLTATAGVAWGHDGRGTVPGGVVAYFRVGKSF